MRRTVILAVVAALGAGLLAGCAEDGEETAGGSAGDGGGGKGRTTITVGVFGAFGLKEAGLYDEYMKLNKHIEIKQTSIERNENYYPQLLTHLGTGSGLADIQAVEVNNIAEITATQADKLVDLGGTEGVSKDAFLPWKWAQATSRDGKTVGLGTDIGPQGICYRKDLFAKAGLPTDREAVGRLWAGDWDKYLAAGRQFKAKAPKGTAFVDSASGIMAAVTGSSAKRFYDENGEVVYKTNPAVKEAWDVAAAFATEGLTGRLQQFTPAWDQGYANGTFATVSCPAWMLGYIQDKSGAAGKGKWDVAPAPKPSNWGGSFLIVPKAGRNTTEAAKLAAWLTAPEQQAKLFEKRGSFPSAKAAYALPAVSGATHDYFGGAPIGEIFSRAAEGIPVTIVGPKDLVIAQNLADIGMLQVDQKGRSSEEGWKAAVKAIDNALDQ
ncbi:carbohydrate ABC transporter substrate-binding protein [Streptomyces sp. ICN441]|uniref:Carbohydrate ABC transporter substrate-binding protein n=1 Tax=Streptomyces tirandamycinicus TaxID=2174846 RepID=A0A2S1SRD6_9ACTN|nr:MULTISPECIES: ABC transporter substrate-binding protein [Streptomyces]AWI28920.1 carbohydrate ABC transporter substrate-binding protein [Streptomyces tirandamycinicus]MCY0985261.1 ABC transporter substrate-binding protein [Streptomyces tirandamycinicus]NNJ04128.1 carbohydrate ABC transporter substrate-binding protein [Streptomyces sp. PKU-MA01144]TFE56096.1 carbohydrate ABC transporter substrate-binding protein [Streptomyces sp. ICN441]